MDKRIWNGSPLGFERDGTPLAYDGDGPTLILGPPGSNKTVGLVINELLDEPGKRSFIIPDPKGEVAAVTANYRRRVCGSENVKIINPYGVLTDKRPDLRSDKWNPIGHLNDQLATFEDDSAAAGEATIKPEPGARDKHFTHGAKEAWTGGIMGEVIEARREGLPPSLANVRACLTQEPVALKRYIRRMIALGHFGITSRMQKFLADTTEVENLKSTVEVNTAWMSRQMREDMATAHGVILDAIAEHPTTIYAITPPHEIKPAYWRLLLSAALRACYRGGVPTTLLIEEAYVLGRLEELEKALAVLRGYRSRTEVVYQSLSQAREQYPAWGMFTSGAVLAFRPADLETAEWMTKRAGQRIAASLSAGDPTNPNEIGGRYTWSPQKRDRIPLEKMFGMPKGTALAWLPNEDAPHIVRVPGYFEIPQLNARADPNPYFAREAKRAWWRT